MHKHAVLCDAGDHSVTAQNHPREHRTNFHDEKTFRAAKCTGKVSQGNAERPRSPRATYSDRAFDRDVTGRRQSPPTPYTAPDWRRLQKQEAALRGRTGGVANFPLGWPTVSVWLWSWLVKRLETGNREAELHRTATHVSVKSKLDSTSSLTLAWHL